MIYCSTTIMQVHAFVLFKLLIKKHKGCYAFVLTMWMN